jgi:CDP-paratose 2-epimerase
LIGDIRDEAAIADAAGEASAVFHFAAQVAVTTSLADPRDDFSTNIGGTLNLLEALRRRNEPVALLFASTNKVYGDLADVALEPTNDAYLPRDPKIRANGIGEERPLEFHTPYGCSKGAADQYVLDYARSFGVPTAVMRMSCVYGPRQMGTEDQGWVAHFVIRALEGRPISIFGDGRQVRDVLHVNDAVAAYLAAWRRIDAVQGHAFNLGGGPANAVSLRQLLDPCGNPDKAAGRARLLRLARRRPALLRLRHFARGGGAWAREAHALAGPGSPTWRSGSTPSAA